MPLCHKDVPFLRRYPDLKLLRQDGEMIPAAEAFHGKKYILIYFSAHWCPPCQRFTPLLADFYNTHKEKCNFEVLFVSSDREEGRMMDFFQNRSSNYVRRPLPAPRPVSPGAPAVTAAVSVSGGAGEDSEACNVATGHSRCCSNSDTCAIGPGAHGETPLPVNAALPTVKARAPRESSITAKGPRVPIASGHGNWLALPFKEQEVARSLSRAYSVVSIPKLIVVAAETSCVLTREGKAMVLRDPEATRFPWRFAEGDMQKGTKGWKVCLLLFLLLSCSYYYYFCYY